MGTSPGGYALWGLKASGLFAVVSVAEWLKFVVTTKWASKSYPQLVCTGFLVVCIVWGHFPWSKMHTLKFRYLSYYLCIPDMWGQSNIQRLLNSLSKEAVLSYSVNPLRSRKQ